MRFARNRGRPSSKRLAARVALACACACACAGPPLGTSPPVTVPAARPSSERPLAVPTRRDDVEELLHGVRVQDPYRWLEDGTHADVRAWTDRENALTRRFLDALPLRARLETRMREWLRIGQLDAPAVITRQGHPSLYFHTKREGDQEQPVLYVREGAAGSDRVLVDVTAAAKGAGNRSLDWWYPSWDGRLLAWGGSEGGDEESTLRVRDVTTGLDHDERIPRTRHASLAWLPDGSGFYYSRYPLKGTVPEGDENYHCAIFFHHLGADWQADSKVFARASKTDLPQVLLSPNGEWLVLRVHRGWGESEVFFRARKAPEGAPWIPVRGEGKALYDPDPHDDRLYLRTNLGAPRFQLFAVEYAHPERAAWKPLIAEGPDALEGVTRVGRDLFASYLHQASTRLERFTLDGRSQGALPLPGIGTAGISGAYDGSEAFVAFTSFASPTRVDRIDLASSAPPSAWDRLGKGVAVPEVQVRLEYATSKDGTQVPMFIVSRNDGNAAPAPGPTILWGYGGFNVTQTPQFSARVLATLDAGGTWVSAILRGGGEFGEAWHQAGMRDQKQNVFDDYLACADWLIAHGVATPSTLAAMGGSNGGLLVTAALTQRPALFRAAVALVPLTDMIRFPRFRIGRLWVDEYGDPELAADFPFLLAYSPYHHVAPDTVYPATLLTTAEADSRVDPMHARKMAARLQAAQRDPSRPVLLRVEREAGHGAGKPASRVAAEVADELAFVFAALTP